MSETDPQLPGLTQAPYTGPGGATGLGLADANGNIIAGLHRRRGGASNLGVSAAEGLGVHWSQMPPPRARNAVPVSRAERGAVAAFIKAGKIAEKIPEGLPDIGHMTADETRDVFKAVSVCTVLVCYVTQAELRRHGLM
jgi:hypothetical protein